MEFTLSAHASTTIRERQIRLIWVEQTLSVPTRTEVDADDPQLTHALGVIPEFGDRVLRVIYNRSKNPPHIVTAFFDRGMKGKL
jgi:hypothetical protein